MKLRQWRVDGMLDKSGNPKMIYTGGNRPLQKEREIAYGKLKYLLRGNPQLICFCKLIDNGMKAV